jgi:hypothetical protein
MSNNAVQISQTAGVLIERLGISLRIAKNDKDDDLFNSIVEVLTVKIQTMDEAEMQNQIRSLEFLIQDAVNNLTN